MQAAFILFIGLGIAFLVASKLNKKTNKQEKIETELEKAFVEEPNIIPHVEEKAPTPVEEVELPKKPKKKSAKKDK